MQPPADGPPVEGGGQPQGVPGEGGGRRRRRRRGGRGRGRNRNRQDQPGLSGALPTGQEEVGDIAFGGHGIRGDQGEYGEQGDQAFENREETAENEMTDAPIGNVGPVIRESFEPEVAATLQNQPVSETAEVVVEEAAPAEGVKKPRRRRGTRGRGRGKKAALETADSAVEAPEVKKSTAVPKALVREAEPDTIVRTGSTDRHQLIVDEDAEEEPIVPSPARRPRTYRDLDEIPDDLD